MCGCIDFVQAQAPEVYWPLSLQKVQNRDVVDSVSRFCLRVSGVFQVFDKGQLSPFTRTFQVLMVALIHSWPKDIAARRQVLPNGAPMTADRAVAMTEFQQI